MLRFFKKKNLLKKDRIKKKIQKIGGELHNVDVCK